MLMIKPDKKVVVIIITHAFYATFFVNYIHKLENKNEIIVILFSDFIENELLDSLVFQKSLRVMNIKNYLTLSNIIILLKQIIFSYHLIKKIYIMPLLLPFLFGLFGYGKMHTLNLKKEEFVKLSINNIFLILNINQFKFFINEILIIISRLLGKITKFPYALGYPNTLAIESSASCNLKCSACLTGLGKLNRKKFMDYDFFEHIIVSNKKLLPYLAHCTLDFFGEPILNKNWIKMIHFVKKNGCFWINGNTHGSFLISDDFAWKIVNSGINRLNIGLDTADENYYLKYRIGGRFDYVIDFIKKIVKAKKRQKRIFPEVCLQFLLTDYNNNEKTKAQFIQLANLLEADSVMFKKFRPEQTEGYNREKYCEYISNNSINNNSNNTNYCPIIYNTVLISKDGFIGPCCLDVQFELVNINLREIEGNNIIKIWNSKKYKAFRKEVLNNRSNVKICRNCEVI